MANRVQYPQDGNNRLHFFFRVLQITHAWAAWTERSRPLSAAIVALWICDHWASLLSPTISCLGGAH